MDREIREERVRAHEPAALLTHPHRYLRDPRNARHAEATRAHVETHQTLLDIGCYNGWLSFCMLESHCCASAVGVELCAANVKMSREYAERKKLPWTCYEGFFDEIDLPGTYDACTMYEVLEHMPFETACACVDKAEKMANLILVSLPEQDHHVNYQHLWTPTEKMIRDTWGERPDFTLDIWEYPGTSIPRNFYCTWRPA